MIKVFTVVFEVPDGDTELTADRITEAFDANAQWTFPEGTSWTVYTGSEREKCKYRNYESGRCIASDIVADYTIENQNLKRDLKRAEEQVQMLEDGLHEYANRITGGEWEKLKEKVKYQNFIITKVFTILELNKRSAKSDALDVLNMWKHKI
jgi:predicted RNase H-like nuclease (RuvC/YqgF family)